MSLNALCQAAEDDFGWPSDQNIDWSIKGVKLRVYRPALLNSNDWPEGQFPIVFHHHGQGQDGGQYEHIARAVVDDGAIFVSVAGDDPGSPELRALIDICMLRWLFTAPDWDGLGPGTGGAARLDGNVVIMGHSNGGEAAHIVAEWFEERPWQDDNDAPEHGMRLCGVVGIAPKSAEISNAPFSNDKFPSLGIPIAGAATVPYLTIEGSIDNDVPGGSLWNTSHSGFDELHGPTDAAKISVWVYDAEHDSFGGGGQIRGGDTRDGLFADDQRARGAEIAGIWSDAFVRRFLFADLGAEPVLFGRELPQSLDVATWWGYHPAYAGEPLLFFGFQPHQSSAVSEHGLRVVVDTMCRPSPGKACLNTSIANGNSKSSEGHGFFAYNWPKHSLRSGLASTLAEFGGSPYFTSILRADFTAPAEDGDPIERTLAWDLSSYKLSDASVLSFRAANVDEAHYPSPGKGCSPKDGDSKDEVDFEVVFVSIDGFEVRVDVSAYARLVAPDIYEVVRPDVVVFECPVSHFLQTVTIPLAEVLCDTFPPEHLRELRFVFDRTSGPKSRAVLLDTIEFQRDRSGQPLCG